MSLRGLMVVRDVPRLRRGGCVAWTSVVLLGLVSLAGAGVCRAGTGLGHGRLHGHAPNDPDDCAPCTRHRKCEWGPALDRARHLADMNCACLAVYSERLRFGYNQHALGQFLFPRVARVDTPAGPSEASLEPLPILPDRGADVSPDLRAAPARPEAAPSAPPPPHAPSPATAPKPPSTNTGGTAPAPDRKP